MSVAALLPALVLKGEGVEHFYAARRGLGRIDFVAHGPGCVAVTGANGAGKSTLLRILAGLLRPRRGTVTVAVEGRAIPQASRVHAVGFASPDLHFYDELTLRENLEFVARARGIARAAVGESLSRVGLETRADDRAAAMSSGLKQRLRLAFALLHRPRVLLLDEPGSHLDADGIAVNDAIVDQFRATGLVVVATNDTREAGRADQRIELRGRGLGHPA